MPRGRRREPMRRRALRNRDAQRNEGQANIERHEQQAEERVFRPRQVQRGIAEQIDDQHDGDPTGRGQKRGADALEENVVDNRVQQSSADIWVLGDSIPYWAGVWAQDTNKLNLRLPDLTIDWLGVRGLHWQSFRQQIEAKVLFSSPPSIIFLHLGGNDLTDSTVVQIKRTMETEIEYLREAFPESIIVWIDILQRQVWRGALKGYDVIEQKRLRINRAGRKLVRSIGRYDVIHPDIDAETPFFRPDGVHLNDVGLEFYLDYIKDSILKNISDNR
ncbi:uncharacterized protein LOC128557690 [Mercenaria mercenaria]|uniref:uncharacterized protein LOC128557690 n=1 Tax=Mercenaria mercenaria TaxID=6596 RepID=UPI00234EDE44|nr:uncharacterized protein LOC128557690 [Mercenaria mercenaria]